ncbi:distal tail protein Dit [Clostridium estertheticum]|uniref:Phage tail family protein n=1 Tax=Clostridium estertheticum TaxID=238834 RepID=A0AA47I6T4_9CLOT|nr:distal tail protein Dit [Clostridium estertheticum]MBU3153507.1 phage tail family protein [Clostridium estertheticum]WAG60908.1 phage tail family protein [Clostridium estertheticum]
MYGITFNGKHSFDDYDLFVMSKSIQPPSKDKIKVPVPFMQGGGWDFSTVGSNGEIIYNTREITIKFCIDTTNVSQLYVKYSEILEWLQGTGQQKLVFDDISDYYFMAEAETPPTFSTFIMLGELEVKFVADPFKIGVDYATNNLWDTFNFEEDYLQDGEYDIVGTKTITLYNPKRLVMPTINVSTAMSIIYNSKTYNLVVGDNKLYGLKLANSVNNIIIINGTGHIKILFKKVSL